MNSILFWKLWPKPYQILFWFLSTSFLVALILFWRGYLSWPAPAITYEHFQQLQTIEVPSHSFSIGLINVTVPADSYLIFENIFGSGLHTDVFASYFFLLTIAIAFVFFLSIATDLSRYRFLISMASRF